jgi:hypothetical protein
VSRLSAGAASGRAATAEKTLEKLNAEGVKVPCMFMSSRFVQQCSTLTVSQSQLRLQRN